MLTKIAFSIILLVFMTGIARAQLFESIEKEAERILISLSDEDSLNPSDIHKLKNLLASEIDDGLTKLYFNVNQRSIDSLKNHLKDFESESQNISTDSAFVLFNAWYLHLQNIFYEYSKEKFFSSHKQKIILFSTSMSCYCTLEMAKKQTIDLLKFIKGNKEKYDYWIIDSFENSELQIEHQTLFAPSLIVFNENNEVVYKIEYEEEMIFQLSNYFF